MATKRETLEQKIAMQLGILKALEALLKTKVYSDIKINEICEEAHVSKTTFYRYFKSKENIITWLARHSLDCGAARIGKDLSPYEGFLRTASMHYTHRIFFCDDPQTEGIFQTLLRYSSVRLYDAFIQTLAAKGIEVTERISYQVDFFCRGIGYVSKRWAEEGMLLSPETYADYCVSMIPDDLADAFGIDS